MTEVTDVRYIPLKNEKHNDSEIIEQIRIQPKPSETNPKMKETVSDNQSNSTAQLNVLPDVAYVNLTTPSTNTSNRFNKNLPNNLRQILNKKFYFLLYFIFVVFGLCVLIMLRLSLRNLYLNRHHTNNICLTDKCILLSSTMYNAMNKDVNPCDDFYEYSCGTWLKTSLIPRGYSRWSTIHKITYSNQLIIKQELESNLGNKNYTNAEQKAISYYQSCMDPNGYIEKAGSKPLFDIIDKFVYKNMSNHLIINETWINLMYITQIQYGLDTLFEMNIVDDDKNSSFNDIELVQSGLDLDRSYYLDLTIDKNRKVLEVLNQTITKVITTIHGNVNNIVDIVNNHIKFSTSLAEIMLPMEKLGEIENTYSRISLKSLTESHTPFINWTQFINNYLSNYSLSERVNDDVTVIVLAKEYFSNLTQLINNENKETLKFYMYYNLVKHLLPLLTEEYRSLYSPLKEALTGATKSERWQECLYRLDDTSTLGFATGRMFIRKKFNDAKSSALDMIDRIRSSLIANFPNNAWMDQETRVLAEEKIKSVIKMIGYPDFIINDDQLNKRYENLYINQTDYFNNEIRLFKFGIKNVLENYGKPVSRTEWDMTPSAVNAYYAPTRNQIVFPAGILQEPFFNVDYPQSFNFGGIGSIMGHELSHGFDDTGREYDKNGNLDQWWNNKTIEEFNKAANCIVDQYSTYKINGENLNGKRTLGENIADNGALRASYHAYLKWIEENGEEKPLPLLGLSQKQIFFVAYAQAWCSIATDDSIHLSLSTDPHSPPKYRVIGSISNSEDFAKHFNCKPGSNMNPTKKCSVL